MSLNRCEQCRRKIRGAPYRSVTGRILCESCGARLQGRTAGLVVGGGAGNAISTAGWFARVRRAMGRGRR
ncbi:hypothetical protein [Brachybacterium hainanense]|uniref:GATA-type domain-containing protein n=1 Tax=Brachybacterium hainanense TaxID=1541174 RepID=A0ABV6RJ47_9MICO